MQRYKFNVFVRFSQLLIRPVTYTRRLENEGAERNSRQHSRQNANKRRRPRRSERSVRSVRVASDHILILETENQQHNVPQNRKHAASCMLCRLINCRGIATVKSQKKGVANNIFQDVANYLEE